MKDIIKGTFLSELAKITMYSLIFGKKYTKSHHKCRFFLGILSRGDLSIQMILTKFEAWRTYKLSSYIKKCIIIIFI